MRLQILLVAFTAACSASPTPSSPEPDASPRMPDASGGTPDATAPVQPDAPASTCTLPLVVTMQLVTDLGPEYDAYLDFKPSATFNPTPDNCALSTTVQPGDSLMLGFSDSLDTSGGTFETFPLGGWRIDSASAGRPLMSSSGTFIVDLPNDMPVTVDATHDATGRRVEVVFQLLHPYHQLQVQSLKILE